MTKEWSPSNRGQKWTKSPDWHLQLKGRDLILSIEGTTHKVRADNPASYTIHQGIIWTDITLFLKSGESVKVDGLPNPSASSLKAALSSANLLATSKSITNWLKKKQLVEHTHLSERRWLTHETQAELLSARPALDIKSLQTQLANPETNLYLGSQAKPIDSLLTQWSANHLNTWAQLNHQVALDEIKSCKKLFKNVESKPLTAEQAYAAVCFDNRVQVIASAGSGKTSTMIAKAAYAIHRGIAEPSDIIMLAFNKQAAEELKERAEKAFTRLGMTNATIEASTFHSLGLKIIGQATGEKPDIPEWAIDPALGVRKLSQIVDDLKQSSASFRTQWDLFRFVFAKDLPDFGSNEKHTSWDDQGNGSLVSINGDNVKSAEELIIANFLFFNGVNYLYEPHYKHKTADANHRQYKPDFYYPDIDLYHEHFALDRNGIPHAEFIGYAEGVTWKRNLHKEMGTKLFETTSFGLRSGQDLLRLGNQLSTLGLNLTHDPNREVPDTGRKPMDAQDLLMLIRVFMGHVKSNSLSSSELHQRLQSLPENTFKLRYSSFLDIAVPVINAWDKLLNSEGGVDFEDMLNQAAAHLEESKLTTQYTLVMADEFQDASQSRARLCRALVKDKGKFFFAVGDDWQSINRFAGADVSVMTGFSRFFGPGQILKLEKTFRCPQELCDISSSFISKNPAQISKQIHSDTPSYGPVLSAFQVEKQANLANAIEQYIYDLAEKVRTGIITPSKNGKVSIYVLGRYNADRQYMPTNLPQVKQWVDLSFLTIHRSKGSEADYVILPEMISAHMRRSFPNDRSDDPLLSLAMPDGETYPLGEERRLFYVALTRARRAVALFTIQGMCSTFLTELVKDRMVSITNMEGEPLHEKNCPACKTGVIILRKGPYGEFESCSSFPVCKFKPKKSRRKQIT